MKEESMNRFHRPMGKRAGERGQSLVETAIALPLLLGVVLGIADLGYMAYCFVLLGNAADAGAHYAAQSVVTAADTAGIQTAVTNDAGTMSNITVSSSFACTCSDGTAITCTNFSACVDPHRVITTVTVTTQKTINALIPWSWSEPVGSVSLPGSVTMHGTARMRVSE